MRRSEQKEAVWLCAMSQTLVLHAATLTRMSVGGLVHAAWAETVRLAKATIRQVASVLRAGRPVTLCQCGATINYRAIEAAFI